MAEIDLPVDFKCVDGVVPKWIDIDGICRDSIRFIGMYAIGGFDVIAINNGRVIFTTADKQGEFRRLFHGALKNKGFDEPPAEKGAQDAVLVYDCADRKQWIAPRHSAVRFLYRQH